MTVNVWWFVALYCNLSGHNKHFNCLLANNSTILHHWLHVISVDVTVNLNSCLPTCSFTLSGLHEWDWFQGHHFALVPAFRNTFRCRVSDMRILIIERPDILEWSKPKTWRGSLSVREVWSRVFWVNRDAFLHFYHGLSLIKLFSTAITNNLDIYSVWTLGRHGTNFMIAYR